MENLVIHANVLLPLLGNDSHYISHCFETCVYFDKMTGAGSTRTVGRMFKNFLIIVALQHSVAFLDMNLDDFDHWYHLYLTRDDYDNYLTSDDYSRHVMEKNEDECLFAAKRDENIFCFGERDGYNCHLSTIKRPGVMVYDPEGSGVYGLKCMTRFSRAG